jgi:hypothetical protein
MESLLARVVHTGEPILYCCSFSTDGIDVHVRPNMKRSGAPIGQCVSTTTVDVLKPSQDLES